jgi:RHS repeat-associated protein
MNPDSFGNLPASACSLGGQSAYGPDRITKTVYDAAGQVVQVRQAVGTSVERVYSTFAYSPNGKVTDSIDANGNRTKMTYDGFDRLSAVYYPDTNRPGGWNPATQATALATAGSHSGSDYEAYAYDENGNRSWWRRRDGNYIYYNYDNLNREILHYNPNGLIPHLYTTYDLTGKVLKKRFNDWNGPGVTYTYDGLGRLQTATDMNGRPLTFYYNQASARTVMTFPDGKTQFYGLDGLNRVVYSDISNSGVAMCLGYDDLGRLSGRCWANNTSEGLGYDNQSRLTNLNYYFPDGSKNIYWGFAYNPANQITTLYANNTTQYDFRETQVQTDNRAFDGLNRDSGIAALSGGYDARGNMTNDGSRQMVYDLYNRLMSVTGNGQNLQMNYDPEGRLASYTVNGATTTFLYDGVKLIAEYDGSGNMQKRYLHGIGTDDPWAELTGSDVNSGTVKYLYANYQGSVFAQANGSGTITDTYKYGPYGEPKNAADQTSFSGSRFRYTGQTVLPEAQLYYYKARVYDPIHGRFLQTDPIGSDDDLNLYGYVGGDPINATDPDGTTRRVAPPVSPNQPRTIGGYIWGRVVANWNARGRQLDPSYRGYTYVGEANQQSANAAREMYARAQAADANRRGVDLGVNQPGARYQNQGASSANASNALNAKLRGLEDSQNLVSRILDSGGRIRYYTPEVPARNPGPTRGASYVTEWNTSTGQTRSWMESYGQSGEVNRVHPKSVNGQTVDSLHYPPTARELAQ